MTTRAEDGWAKALALFNRGEVSAGMGVLALTFDALAHRAIHDETRDSLGRCGQAARVIATEWSALSSEVAKRVQRMLAESPAAWVKCPDCNEYFCLIHMTHVVECDCPPVDEWDVDPYAEGRPAQVPRAASLGVRQ